MPKENKLLVSNKEISKEEIISSEQAYVEIINSIKKKYPKLRQKSKAPSFALTYMGTWKTLTKNCGMSVEDAQATEKAYHDLYQVSDQYSLDAIKLASKQGYLDVAFGLRLRCPRLQTDTTSHIARSQIRTLNNAMGQSYCALTMRASIWFGHVTRMLGYGTKILPCLTVHDALYFRSEDDVQTLKVTKLLIERAFAWQEDPKISHPKVKLKGDLEHFYPSWAYPKET